MNIENQNIAPAEIEFGVNADSAINHVPGVSYRADGVALGEMKLDVIATEAKTSGAYFRPTGSDARESLGDVAPATITLNTTDIGIDRASLYTDAVTSVSAAVDPADYDEFAKRFLADYLNSTSQTKLKRSGKALRRHNILHKRANTAELVGIDLVAENAHPHGSRAIRRRVSHDARKGTKPGLFGRGSVRMTDADLVERHGRSALHVMSDDRFRKALDELNAADRRLDLRAKSGFQKTVEALSEVMGRRVA